MSRSFRDRRRESQAADARTRPGSRLPWRRYLARRSQAKLSSLSSSSRARRKGDSPTGGVEHPTESNRRDPDSETRSRRRRRRRAPQTSARRARRAAVPDADADRPLHFSFASPRIALSQNSRTIFASAAAESTVSIGSAGSVRPELRRREARRRKSSRLRKTSRPSLEDARYRRRSRDISRRPLPISEHLLPISVPRTRLCLCRSFRLFARRSRRAKGFEVRTRRCSRAARGAAPETTRVFFPSRRRTKRPSGTPRRTRRPPPFPPRAPAPTAASGRT
mmetsp:Transcript_5480/g.23191  ORF Transcript_5480/g.23191 Transcript_5480/m.23191 type:complete len:279 (+) Transcript_5480:974-1810(+)